MASGSTPKLRYPQLDSLDDIDYTELNTAYATTENELTPSAFTTSTRPTGAARWDGRVILDTDLGKYIKWNANEAGWRSVDYDGDSSPTLGLTAGSGITLGSVAFTHKNGIASISFGFSRNATIADGDIGNITIATIQNSKWFPKITTALSVGAAGPLLGIVVDTGGNIILGSTGAAISANYQLSCAGIWILT